MFHSPADFFSAGRKKLRRDHAGTQPQPTNLQVDTVLKSWSQARRLIKDTLVRAAKEVRNKHAVAEFSLPRNSSSNSAPFPVVLLRDTSTKGHSSVDANNSISHFYNDLENVTKLRNFLGPRACKSEAEKHQETALDTSAILVVWPAFLPVRCHRRTSTSRTPRALTAGCPRVPSKYFFDWLFERFC